MPIAQHALMFFLKTLPSSFLTDCILRLDHAFAERQQMGGEDGCSSRWKLCPIHVLWFFSKFISDRRLLCTDMPSVLRVVKGRILEHVPNSKHVQSHDSTLNQLNFSLLPSLVFIFAMQLCCSMMHQCPFETRSPQLEGESDGIWGLTMKHLFHSLFHIVVDPMFRICLTNDVSGILWTCIMESAECSIFVLTYLSHLVASALFRTMAWSDAFVNNLCWRLKALGAPKVHHSSIFLGNGFFSFCF